VDIVEIRDAEQLAAMAGEWNDLLRRTANNHVFLTHEWITTWWEVYGAESELLVLLAREDGNVIGIAPLYITQAGRAKFCPRTEVRFLGGHPIPADFVDFIIPEDRKSDILPVFLDYLSANAAWHMLVLKSLNADTAHLDVFRAWCERSGARMCACQEHPCPVLDVPGTMDDVLKNMDRKFRKNVKNGSVKRLEEAHEVQFMPNAPEGRVDEYVDTLGRLHMDRWATVDVEGQFTDERTVFYRRLAHVMQERGWLRLSALDVDGQVVTMLYGIAYGEAFYALQLGCGPEGRDLRAGNVIFYKVLETLAGNATVFHFLRGEETYKYKWGAVNRCTISTCISGRFPGTFMLMAKREVCKRRQNRTQIELTP